MAQQRAVEAPVVADVHDEADGERPSPDGLSRRTFLIAGTGGALGASLASPVTAGASEASEAKVTGADPVDRSFTNLGFIRNGTCGVQLSAGARPAQGRLWEVRRVYWNVNAEGAVGSQVQTYLYKLPASWPDSQAVDHMTKSLGGWLGCCGNALLTGNGDMSFGSRDVVVRPNDKLWIYFITVADNNNFTTAVGMSVDEWSSQDYATTT
jgi:hypothetical protein